MDNFINMLGSTYKYQRINFEEFKKKVDSGQYIPVKDMLDGYLYYDPSQYLDIHVKVLSVIVQYKTGEYDVLNHIINYNMFWDRLYLHDKQYRIYDIPRSEIVYNKRIPKDSYVLIRAYKIPVYFVNVDQQYIDPPDLYYIPQIKTIIQKHPQRTHLAKRRTIIDNYIPVA